MWQFSPRSAVVGLAALSTLAPTALAKPYPVHLEELLLQHNTSQLLPRQAACASGITCGYGGWLCCPSGSKCFTDANNQAQCDTSGGSGQTTAAGSWVTHTTTYVQTVDLVTYTSLYSSFVPATATAICKNDVQVPCGGKCCDSGYYCLTSSNTCALIGGGSSGGIAPTGPLNPSAPLRPTSSGIVIVTYTGTPTATQPFSSPIPTGAAGGGLTETGSGGGLSGGAIAGIVIGVILGILLLFLLCLYCCARALFDTILAIFGFGKKRKHTHEETYIEEHHHSGGAAAGGGRWYGGRPARPSRVGSEKHSGAKKGLGMAAALGGLALALGLKRKHDQRHDDKSTTISGSSAYYSDYTSSSSASSSDRRTRRTQHSSRR
ncbi:hypothetical protein T440DRAFT_504428 [Plenodomus tracheiphilus IPT5]|uniref:Uncharacterized protein n=1 Tax=Plenodomus tracheiphilus IPT5 TaxID=1408161 RepID=A0A6A7BK44_9PLEO|nr:hypothetical protein T440DRAFT_504428 [Plenodomus tracheiphilus IPT5]